MSVSVLALLAGILVAVAFCLYRKKSGSDSDDPSGMVGQAGTAQTTFAQEGMVLVRGELWRATSGGGIIQKGASVTVREVRPGLILLVDRADK